MDLRPFESEPFNYSNDLFIIIEAILGDGFNGAISPIPLALTCIIIKEACMSEARRAINECENHTVKTEHPFIEREGA